MSLQSGMKLGPYEVGAMIGAGGMGEVYRGRDTRLDRQVAIKVLPAHLAEQPDLRERFEREARAVAALNHPNICTLYDVGQRDGTHFLVMEYIEGETLAQRLTRGPLPVEEALRNAAQISDALDKAHRQGVVHRDLKPGNIMLAKSGAKLLDFGLARLKQPSSSPAYSSASAAPTNAALTTQGAILGTLQYMAPEQLEGRDADPRTDVFGFGSVVYEMITGRKAFEGKSQVSLIGAILEREPAPLTTVQPATPPDLDRVIRRCLAKDPDERWQTMTDLTAQLTWLAGNMTAAQSGIRPAAVAPALPSKTGRPSRFWMAAALLFFVVAVVFAAAYFYRPQEIPDVVRFALPAPEKTILESGANNAVGYSGGAISPDGRRFALTARDASGKLMLWVRSLDSLQAQALTGTEGAGLPFWSPDSRSIGFFADGKLKRVDAAGGAPQTLCDAESGRGGAWNRDGVILFAPSPRTPLSRVPAAGGSPVAATKLIAPQANHRFPSFLPDGKHFIYFAQGVPRGNLSIFLGSLDSMDATPLIAADAPAIYSAAGYLLFPRQNTLLAQPFDLKKLRVTGEAVPIAEQVAATENQALAASVSNNGTLAFRIGLGNPGKVLLTWMDRTGKVVQTIGMPGSYQGVDISRDGKRVALHIHEGTGGDIWVMDSSGGPLSHLTFDATQENSSAIWSPDGLRIAYGSVRNGKWGIYLKLANGTGTEDLLFESEATKVPMSWSPDGKFVIFEMEDPKTRGDIWAIPVSGDRKPFPIIQNPTNQGLPQVSPDGKWIAYLSNETGRNEMHVSSFPAATGHWQVTTEGTSNYSFRWRGDSKEIYYVGPGAAAKLMAIPVNPSGSSFQWGASYPLFDTGYVGVLGAHRGSYHDYAVSPDGQRFLIPRPESALASSVTEPPVIVVLNWPTLLTRK